MCCLHLEISVPGHQFQSLSGFLPGYGRRRGLSHLHKQSFDSSNLVVFIQVTKTKRKTNQVEKKKKLLLVVPDRETSGNVYFKVQVMKKTQVHSVIRPDDGYSITHRFNGDVSLENPQ